jgi:hypothetical protein
MTATVTWTGTLTAVSSIAHGGETRGTITLLRRELIVQPDGHAALVPVISGNSLRGVLRRAGELLLRDAVGYHGQLPLAAAHALRAGGSLAKVSGEPLSGSRLQLLRDLVPQVGVFGCAAGGRIIDGCLQVGKLMPHVAECAHLIPVAVPVRPAADATQLETFIRRDDTAFHDSCVPPGDQDEADSQLMMYRVETFPAGTRFAAWLRLVRATPLETAFFGEVLAGFQEHGRIGGRAGTGHGLVSADLHRDPPFAASPEPALPDWRAVLTARRAEVIGALATLT